MGMFEGGWNFRPARGARIETAMRPNDLLNSDTFAPLAGRGLKLERFTTMTWTAKLSPRSRGAD